MIMNTPMRGITRLLPLLLLLGSAKAAMLHLTVTNPAGQPLPGVTVVLPDGRGAATDVNGLAVLDKVSGTFTLTLSCVGFEGRKLTLDLPAQGHPSRSITLTPMDLPLEAMTIQGRKAAGMDLQGGRETERISVEDASARATDGSARAALGAMTGVDTRPCGLCGSAGVGLQGLDPNYTEVRMDGLALMSGVGALYGMDAVGVGQLASMAVTRGAVSSSEGSGAVAGSVELESRVPSGTDTLQLRLSLGDGWRHGAGITAGRNLAGLPMLMGLDWQADPQRIDRNGDQLTDTPQVGRLASQISAGRSSQALRWNIAASGLREKRFAGDTDWTEGDRGDAATYGRDIAIRRGEMRFNSEGLLGKAGAWSLGGALVRHVQESWYGATSFNASQRRALLQAGLSRQWAGSAVTRLQAFTTDEKYQDNLLDGDGLPLPTDRHDRVPGASISQSAMSGPFRWELGLRMERQDEGWIPLGRGSVATQPTPQTTLRLSASQGYRQVTLFSLDKAVHAGFDHVVLPERLEPERTLSLNLGLQQELVLQGGRLKANLSLFDVELWEKAVLRYTASAGHLEYGNARRAHSRGVEARAEWLGWSGWRLSGGGTWSRVMVDLDEGWQEEELAGSWTANAGLGRRGIANLSGLGAEMRVRATGSQLMPEGRERERTPAWAVVDASVDYRGWNWTLGVDLENLLDYVQPDNPLVEGGEHAGMLDSALIYGPLIGRRARLRATLDF